MPQITLLKERNREAGTGDTVVTGLFNTVDDGFAAMEDLVSNGFSRGDISFIAKDPRSEQLDGTEINPRVGKDLDPAGNGVSGGFTGAAIGGGLGLLAGLPAML